MAVAFGDQGEPLQIFLMDQHAAALRAYNKRPITAGKTERREQLRTVSHLGLWRAIAGESCEQAMRAMAKTERGQRVLVLYDAWLQSYQR